MLSKSAHDERNSVLLAVIFLVCRYSSIHHSQFWLSWRMRWGLRRLPAEPRLVFARWVPAHSRRYQVARMSPVRSFKLNRLPWRNDGGTMNGHADRDAELLCTIFSLATSSCIDLKLGVASGCRPSVVPDDVLPSHSELPIHDAEPRSLAYANKACRFISFCTSPLGQDVSRSHGWQDGGGHSRSGVSRRVGE